MSLITDRDLKENYINKKDSPRHREIMYDCLSSNNYSIARDIINPALDDEADDIIEYWRNKALDHLIASIDWSKLGQCKECHEYYDYSYDLPEGFCSHECAANYVADDDRRDR